jgi:hypothetical protein
MEAGKPMNRKSRRNLRFFLFQLVLLGCLTALPAFAMEPPQLSGRTDDLLAHAQPVMKLDSLLDEAAGIGKAFNDPLWLSANVLLAHGSMGDGFFENPYRIELKEHRVTPLPRLFTPETIWDNKGNLPAWTLSSDHRWILWRHGWLEPQYDFVATRIDGGKSVRWTVGRADANGPFFWQPGTHRWVHLLLTDDGETLREAQLFDLDHPDRKRTVPLPPLKQIHLVGVRPDGSYLLTDSAEWHSIKGRWVHLTDLRFMPDRAPFGIRAMISSPAAGRVAQMRLSPDGKRLAWLIEQGVTRDKDGSPTPQSARLYVSGVDGKDPRALGSVRFKKDSDEYGTLLHGWYPDSRRLLLQYRDHLYCIAAR